MAILPGAVAWGVTSEAGAQARPCGPHCQSCVDALRIPRGAGGEPLFRQSPVSKATFRDCIARTRPHGGVLDGGNGKRAGAQ